MIIVTIAAAISSKDGLDHQTMGDVAVSIAIEVVTTTDMTVVVMATDDRLLQGAVIEEALIAMTVAEGVVRVRRSDVVDATGVLIVDTTMAVPCPAEGLIRSRTYRSFHKSHRKGLSGFLYVLTFGANNDAELSCSTSSNRSRHVASNATFSFSAPSLPKLQSSVARSSKVYTR